MKTIKFISFFVPLAEQHKRTLVPAAQTKVQYITEALNNVGYCVEMISASRAKEKKLKNYCFVDGENRYQCLADSNSKFFLLRKIYGLLFKIKLFIKLLYSLSSSDCVVVYHSLYYMKALSLLKRIKRFKLILEVEEIYSDVVNDDNMRRKELAFFRKADSYILSNDLLNEMINKNNKPYVVCYGTYSVQTKLADKYGDGKIHCVYAGTLDIRKGGCAAAAAAEFLTNKYFVHIIGFGGEDEKRKLQNIIDDVRSKTECGISFDGLVRGDDYIKYIQKCDIGLSTQNPDAEFNNTSFPSKVLSYLSNGLRVVTVDIPAIRNSKISDILFFYDGKSPKSIAESILKIDITQEYDSRKYIVGLASDFEKNLKSLLQR